MSDEKKPEVSGTTNEAAGNAEAMAIEENQTRLRYAAIKTTPVAEKAAVIKFFEEHGEKLNVGSSPLTEEKFAETVKTIRESLAKGTDAEAIIKEANDSLSKLAEAAKDGAEAAKKASFWAENFSKDVKGNFKASSKGITFARVAGTGAGLILAGNGLSEAIQKDEEGERHVLAGLTKTAVGAGITAVSLLAKSKGAAIPV